MTKLDCTGKEYLDAIALARRSGITIYRWLRPELPENARLLEFGAGKGEYCNHFHAARQAVELDAHMHRVAG